MLVKCNNSDKYFLLGISQDFGAGFIPILQMKRLKVEGNSLVRDDASDRV